MQELAEAVEVEPVPNLADVLKEIAKALQSNPSTRQTYIGTIEKLVNFAQRDINIQEQNITI